MSSKVTKYFAAFAVTLLAIVLAGCGSGNKEGAGVSSGSAQFGNVATVGDTACEQCHSATTETLTGETIVAEYQQNSPHNQDGLGCESCHGGGAMHNGVGPIPYPAPDADRCATCHDGTTVVAGKTAPATNSATDFGTSVHASGVNGTGAVVEADHGQPCVRCHSNEGGILSAKYGFTGDRDLLDNTTYEGQVPPAASYTAITCETCHEHGAGLRVVKTHAADGTLVNWNPSGTGKANDQFNLCTSCHGLITNDGKVMASGDVVYGNLSTAKVGHHENDWYRTIATTHYDNLDNANLSITGYVVRKAGDTPCFDCHGHEARTNTRTVSQSTDTSYTAAGAIHYDSSSATIYTDWAQSVHAGFMLADKIAAASGLSGTAQTDAVMNTGIAEAFNHADWTTTGEQDCQRCHTATGASNFMTSPSTYDPTKNDFSHLAGWSSRSASPSSTQRELIYCWGCHSNAANGVVRNPGAVPAVYTYNGATVTFPDVGDSNTCITCHSGRGNSDTITNDDRTVKKWSSLVAHGSVAHHGPTAGTVFSAVSHVGYEFPGQSYANVAYFQHDKIGTTAAEADTGTHGPCAACHMGDSSAYGKASHTFEAVTYTDSTATTISTITNPSLCAKCHSGTHEMTVAELQANKDEATNASQLLTDILKQANGQTNYAATDMTAAAFLDGASATVNDLGAVNNSGYLASSDKGAYVHNRVYFKRLIFDSIDWAQNGALTGSITIPASYTGATTWFGADATTGIANKRP
jgi:mono/diheme cytochrome c family protein